MPYNYRTPLGQSIIYPCKNWSMSLNDAYYGYRIENNTDFKSHASSNVSVMCGPTGNYSYPPVWPQCSQNVSCIDPSFTSELKRTEQAETPTNHAYLAGLSYFCTDKRKYIKPNSTSTVLTPVINTTCNWRKTYDKNVQAFRCQIHHCAHPYYDDGYFIPPGYNLSLTLVETYQTLSSFVPLGSFINFVCDTDTFIESTEGDPVRNQIFVQCSSPLGVYDIPPAVGYYIYNTSLAPVPNYVPGQWPNCTATVKCGQPPAMPLNGSISWLHGATALQVYHKYLCTMKKGLGKRCSTLFSGHLQNDC